MIIAHSIHVILYLGKQELTFHDPQEYLSLVPLDTNEPIFKTYEGVCKK